jgi:hypothetical protein
VERVRGNYGAVAAEELTIAGYLAGATADKNENSNERPKVERERTRGFKERRIEGRSTGAQALGKRLH